MPTLRFERFFGVEIVLRRMTDTYNEDCLLPDLIKDPMGVPSLPIQELADLPVKLPALLRDGTAGRELLQRKDSPVESPNPLVGVLGVLLVEPE